MMETYLTIEDVAVYLKLAEQTIRRWVLNREIPFCKIKKVIRFRVSEIEKWVDTGGLKMAAENRGDTEGGLFHDAVPPLVETEQAEQTTEIGSAI
ncbi:MAG: helix-turn-helix domain-containing protein [Treponema sp.]|jgi:excisionase family DNA binding protein|nr:helix-turn-helix domain-containing protein [Treponema sp.]